MDDTTSKAPEYDVIIVGGSYSGLAAAMSLGRALRNVLIIDSGKPCNIQTPHSHNFITQDGKSPGEILEAARAQVRAYPGVAFFNGLALEARQTAAGFDVATETGDLFNASKLIFAAGVKDQLPAIAGFSECWGISILHCPYCHGYEVRNEKTAILANGAIAFELSKLISNWTRDLILFTNGPSTLTEEQRVKLAVHRIEVVETAIDRFEHQSGQVYSIVLSTGETVPIKAVYARPAFEQNCSIPKRLGCEVTEQGYIAVDAMQKTKVHGVYACGDSTTGLRSLAHAVGTGTFAGAVANKDLIEERF